MAEIATMIDAKTVMRRCTIRVRVKGLGVAKARLWLAAKIIALAALVAGCAFEVESEFAD